MITEAERLKRNEALAYNGFYAFQKNPASTVWTILEITHDLANERMVLIGDRLISIRGQTMLEYSAEDVKLLMQQPLNGDFL
jgi:hypothetical protein